MGGTDGHAWILSHTDAPGLASLSPSRCSVLGWRHGMGQPGVGFFFFFLRWRRVLDLQMGGLGSVLGFLPDCTVPVCSPRCQRVPPPPRASSSSSSVTERQDPHPIKKGL